MRKRKHQQRKRSRSDSGRARSSRRGFCSTQRVISTPPLSSHNWYACLVVDQCEDATSVFDCVKVVPQPSPPLTEYYYDSPYQLSLILRHLPYLEVTHFRAPPG